MTTRTKILIGLGAVAAVVLAFGAWQGVRAFVAWNSVERVAFDLDAARAELPELETIADVTTTTVTPSGPLPTYTSVLVIGSDEKPPDIQEKEFADAVLLYLLPDDGSGPAIVSFPRDIVVRDPCTGERSKFNRMLDPCGVAISGPEHAALAMEALSGIPVDHFALVKFDAFSQLVDQVGGVDVCVENALREGGYDIMPAGCSNLDGEHALAWIRSRSTQEFIDGEWVFASELGDAARVGRHQTLMFALLAKMKGIRSPADLAGMAENLGDTIVLSETFGLGEAIALAWELRNLDPSVIRTYTMRTEPDPLDDGSYAVRATATVRELIEGDR